MNKAKTLLEECCEWAENSMDKMETLSDVEKVGGVLNAVQAIKRHLRKDAGEAARAADMDEEEENELLGWIEDELKGAEDYYKLWRQDNDPELKEMSAQELKHADHWIRKARESGEVPVDQLQDAVTWRGAILAKLA